MISVWQLAYYVPLLMLTHTKNLEGLMPSKKNYLLDHRIIEMT